MAEVTFHPVCVPLVVAVSLDTRVDSELAREWRGWADRGPQRLYVAVTWALILADHELEPLD